MPSSSGQATASSAALVARSGPPACAVPIIALPGSLITVFTSSKSTLTRPGTWMMSLMPPTAFFSTSLACAKACSCVTSSPITSSSFSLSTTIRLSTLASSSADAVVGLLAAALALELEGLGDHADGQDAHLLGHARDHRRRAGAGAAAHAGGDEQHVRAADGLADAVHRLFGRGRARPRACCRRPGRCCPAAPAVRRRCG